MGRPDNERQRRLRNALVDSGLEAVLSARPSDVLLLTGFWPVMGTSIAIFPREGDPLLIVPEDEHELAEGSSSARLAPYSGTTLKIERTTLQALAEPLASALKQLGLHTGRLGLPMKDNLQPATYLTSARYGDSLPGWLREHAPGLRLVSADDLLAAQKAVRTSAELERLRLGCRLAGDGFQALEREPTRFLQAGRREAEVAADLQHVFDSNPAAEQAQRSYGFFFCMSGPNSATASAAYARTRQRRLEAGDLVMIHANTCCDGLWTDITRTYTVGDPSPRHQSMQTAIAEARAAALASIRPGVPTHEVDAAARSVMKAHGFGEAFRHALGHGVGYAAAYGGALPRLHPQSPDILAEGMTFNVEPAAYFTDYGGMRHCDVVAVTADGVEVLTEF